MTTWKLVKSDGTLSNGIRYYDAHWIKYDKPQLCDCGQENKLYVEMRGESEVDWWEMCVKCAEAEGIVRRMHKVPKDATRMPLRIFLRRLRRRKKGAFVLDGYAVDQGELTLKYYVEWDDEANDWYIYRVIVVGVKVGPQYDSLGEGYEHIRVGSDITRELFLSDEKKILEDNCMDDIVSVEWE